MSNQFKRDDWDGWYPVGCLGPYNYHDFPLWLAKTDRGQVQLWMTKQEMEAREPLWTLATHWRPAKQDIPIPPGQLGAINLRKRTRNEYNAYVAGYNAAIVALKGRLENMIPLVGDEP